MTHSIVASCAPRKGPSHTYVRLFVGNIDYDSGDLRNNILMEKWSNMYKHHHGRAGSKSMCGVVANRLFIYLVAPAKLHEKNVFCEYCRLTYTCQGACSCCGVTHQNIGALMQDCSDLGEEQICRVVVRNFEFLAC